MSTASIDPDRIPARQRVHYAWVVFAVTFVAITMAAGMRAAPGVLLDPLHDQFGWSKSSISVAVFINVLLFGFVGPFAAALMGRYGLRRIVASGLVLIAIGGGLAAFVTKPWHLWVLWGVVVGTGAGCMASVLAATVANRWFVTRRGLVTGSLTAAGATGQVVFLQLLTRLSDGPGWKWVPFAVCIAALAAVPLVLVLLRDKPEDVGLRAYGAPEGYRTPEPISNPVATAFEGLRVISRTGAFWMLWGSFMVCGLSTNGLIQTHFISAAHDHGIARTHAAGLLASIGLLDIVGTLASGWLTDRVDPRRLLFAYYGLRGLSLLALEPALRSSSAPLWAFIIFYGLDWVATVPPTIALCREVCGDEWATVGFGWVFAGHQVGAAVAALGAGVIRDVTGSYELAWVIAGAGCLVAALGVLRIGGGASTLPLVDDDVSPLVTV